MIVKRPLQRRPINPLISKLVITRRSNEAGKLHLARLQAGQVTMLCVIGKSGATRAKREGDGKSPLGCVRILWGYRRADRTLQPVSMIPFASVRSTDGWCDDVRSGSYNRPIRLPHAARHERMCRDDQQYDLVLVLGYNFPCVKRFAGSAIFFHIWRSPNVGTEGCVAISPENMRKLLPRLGRGATMNILQ